MKHIRRITEIPQRADDTTVVSMVITAMEGILEALATYFDAKESS